MEKKSASKEKNLSDLHNFLKSKIKEQVKEIKPEPMSIEESNTFYNNIIIPAFKTLKTEMLQYNLESIGYNKHVKISTLKVADTLSHFIFKVEIDNVARKIVIYYQLKFRLKLREKLIDARLDEKETIPFNEIKSITQEKIISLFTKWYIDKDEQINKLQLTKNN